MSKALNILMLNQDWFASELKELGHHVITCGIRTHLDLQLEGFEHIHDVFKSLDFNTDEPDLIIIHDESSPWYFTGLECVDMPIIFYSVDIHHHHENHICMAGACDYTFVAQRDYIPLFDRLAIDAKWLPLWPSVFLEPKAEKELGAVFIGTLNEKLNPDRVKFFKALQDEVDITVKQGDYRVIFPKSEMVVNQTVKGDLNFRVFEGMMCGCLMLTEESDNGLLELFENKKHLVTYKKNDYKDAAEKIRYYIENQAELKEIAKNGRDEVLKNHSAMSRAKTLIECLENKSSNRFLKCAGQIASFNWATRGFLKEESPFGLSASQHAVRLINEALDRQEPFSTDIIFHAVFSCLKYDLLFKRNLGEQLLQRISETFPEQVLPKIALVWKMLNRGEEQNVVKSLAQMNLDPSSKTYSLINDAVAEVLNY